MAGQRDKYIEELLNENMILETQVKHLTNDLRLTKKEYEASTSNYYKIYSNMERIVQERTKELQELQKSLEQKGKELQIMLDSSPGMIFYKDAEQKHIRVNKKYGETLGVPIREIIGKTYAELFPENLDHGLRKDLKVIEGGEPLLNQAELLETSNGRRQILIDRVAYKDISERVSGIIGFALDVTDLKRVEAENKELESQLVQAQKMESIGILAGGIAHDFNNILAIILGNSYLLDMELEDTDRLKHPISQIIDATERATNVVRTLLDYARPQKFKFKPTRLHVHVSYVVRQLQKSHLYEDSRIRISLLGDRECLANVDPGKIEQALFNLGKNSLYAIPEEMSGRITYELKVVDLDEGFCRTRLGLEPGTYVSISVSDTGEGISEENRAKVFEPFFTTKQIGDGTGLGLSQVYSIVREHGGHIDLETEEGKGTTITIYLKNCATPAPTEEEDIENLLGDYGARGEKVLVVEDTNQMMDLVVRVLERFGYDVETARNGREGVAKFGEVNPDLVIMDVKMPDMDGIEAFKQIRKRWGQAKIIFSSGHGMTEEDFIELGANGTVPKPYDPRTIARRVREVLDS